MAGQKREMSVGGKCETEGERKSAGRKRIQTRQHNIWH